jgi:hypothetical protein
VHATLAREHQSTAVSKMIARLKLAEKPTISWATIANQPPEGSTLLQVQAHQLFCSTMVTLAAIVPTTAGTERAGKAYPLIHTRLRSALAPNTLMMLIYIFHNMRLMQPATSNDSVSFDDFALGLLDEEEAQTVAAELPALASIGRFREALPSHSAELGSDSSNTSSEPAAVDSSDLEEEVMSVGEESADGAEGGAGQEPAAAASLVPKGYTPIVQAPTGPLTEADLHRSIMAQVKVGSSPLSWRFGTLVRHFKPGQAYSNKYNFDVLFAGEKGPAGMLLEANGERTEYDARASALAVEGTWFFVMRTEGGAE